MRIVAQSVFILGFGLLALSATLFGVAGAMRIFAFSIAPVTALVNFLQASLILLRIQLLAMAIASHAATAATWLLNIALYANPIGLIILAVIALIAAVIGVAYVIWRFRDAIIDGLGYAWNWVKDNWPLLLAIISGPFGLAVYAIIRYKDQIIAIIQGLIDKIKDLWPDDFGDFFGGLGSAVGKLGGVLGFAEGGIVPGPAGAPRAAIVHGGEAIFPTSMLQRLALGPAA